MSLLARTHPPSSKTQRCHEGLCKPCAMNLSQNRPPQNPEEKGETEEGTVSKSEISLVYEIAPQEELVLPT
ncbi:double-stranded RNA-binding protein Staufen homolog 2 [Lates japonicus]|uniref:Double-stranded RNA-binding protein Staufen homolog 2 n=1 Tax=Lates japonicus TaxID=270547 RepID=A0AAD3NF55_LATJO|nr:double-stranded RNA-binding protein Staufen homolog 2 [Lates japonicus]